MSADWVHIDHQSASRRYLTVVVSLFAMMFHSDPARRLRNKPAWTKDYRIFAAGSDQPTSSGSKRFAIDSPLEETGFEPRVPGCGIHNEAEPCSS
jgi:hypothetical protein